MVAVCCCVSQLAAASPGQGPAAAGRPGSSGARGLIATTYPVDGSAMGVALNSIGAQSSAGTARLLYDYPVQQRSEILDCLFKPNYGASFQHLKVESESVSASGPSSSQPWRGGQTSPSHTARTG